MELLCSTTTPTRSFYLVSAPTMSSLAEAVGTVGQSFVLFIAADSDKAEQDEINFLVLPLVKQGLASFCAWGPGCSDLEGKVDLAIVLNGLEASDDDVIATTSHEGEPLEEALWYFANCAFPANDCQRWIAASIGNQTWANEIRRLIPTVLQPQPDD